MNFYQQRQQSESEQAAALKRAWQEQAEDIQWLLSDERGRRIVWRWLEACGLRRLSYTGDQRTLFREGQRSLGLDLWTLVETHCPQRLAELVLMKRTPQGEIK